MRLLVPSLLPARRGWFRHLLPGLIARGDERYAFHFLIEPVLTAFFRFYCQGFEREYEGFRRDVLETLGKAIMMSSLWDEDGESICAQYQDWQTHLLAWLAGSYEILTSEMPHFKDIEKATINIKWLHSWTLEKAAPLIPVANTREFLKALRRVLTLDTLYAWLDNISRYSELSEPLTSARIAEIVADVVLAG